MQICLVGVTKFSYYDNSYKYVSVIDDLVVTMSIFKGFKFIQSQVKYRFFTPLKNSITSCNDIV